MSDEDQQLSQALDQELDQQLDRQSGTVKWFNDAKGFGFIERENQTDVFVHYRSIRGEGFRTLKHDARVAFNLIESEKGFHAEDVAEL